MKRLAYSLALLAGLLWAINASAQHAAVSETPPGKASQTPPDPAARAPGPAQRVRFAPQFTPGAVFRYQMDFRTTTETRRTGLIEDPQAPSQLEISWGAVVRLEVLGVRPVSVEPGSDTADRPAASSQPSVVKPVGEGPRAGVRLRATYERSAATARSDAFDPQAAVLEEQYRKLEGRTLTFTLDAEGKVSEIEGLEAIFADEGAARTAQEGLVQLALGMSLPKGGIVPGQQWSSEQPVASVPVAGTVWRSESTYLRDERCHSISDQETAGAGTPAGPLPDGTCAVILTRLEMTQPRALRDPTPEEYRKRGLRTAGKWSGSAESLSYVSLLTGWVVSSTQSSTEEMDVTVSRADGASSVRYAGRVRSESQVTLMPESPPSSR